jgi:hypothetical protein
LARARIQPELCIEKHKVRKSYKVRSTSMRWGMNAETIWEWFWGTLCLRNEAPHRGGPVPKKRSIFLLVSVCYDSYEAVGWFALFGVSGDATLGRFGRS